MTCNSQDIFETLDHIRQKIKPFLPIEIYIFDNASTADYQNQLKEYRSICHLHFHTENRGFGYGHNYNFAQIKDEYVIVHNPDVLASRETLLQMYDFMEQHQRVWMTTPKVLNEDGSTQFLVRRHLDVFDYMLRFVPFKWVKKLFDDRLARFECRDLTDENQEIRLGSGCFMFLRHQPVVDLGGFDDRFFMYFEDNDICQRIRQYGGQIYYIPKATVLHYYGKEAHRNRKLFWIFLRSMARYFNKWGWNFF